MPKLNPSCRTLLLFNIRTDTADTSLGFTTAWINTFARNFLRVVVVTMNAGALQLEPNVRLYSIDSHGRTRFASIARFYRIMLRVLRTQPIDCCFAHMTPVLAVLFAPLARIYGIPIVLWYAHGAVPIDLRIAERLVDRCVTSTPDGFRLESAKLWVLHQGIDTGRFQPGTSRPSSYERTILSIGRLTPSKRIDEIIDAAALLKREGVDSARLVVFGGAITDADHLYRRRLAASAKSLAQDGVIEFAGPTPYSEVHEAYRQGGIFVNLSETRSLDKAILEGMASGCIPISRNKSFAELAHEEDLEFLVPGSTAASVAERIRAVMQLPGPEREALRARLREIVVERHGLEDLIETITSHLRELANRGKPRGRRFSAR